MSIVKQKTNNYVITPKRVPSNKIYGYSVLNTSHITYYI